MGPARSPSLSERTTTFLSAAQRHLGEELCFAGPIPLECVLPPHFNDPGLVSAKDGRKFVMRLARPNLKNGEDGRVCRELVNLAFFEQGGSYALRSPVEQWRFHDRCRQARLAVPAMVYADANGSLVEFIDGTNVSILLARQRSTGPMHRYLDDIRVNQRAGLILGDRHCCNAIEDRDGRIWQIDADVRIEGPCTRELEICQAIFYSLHALGGSEEGIDVALEFLATAHADYAMRYVKRFLAAFRSFKGSAAYADGKYAAVVPCISRILDRFPTPRKETPRLRR